MILAGTGHRPEKLGGYAPRIFAKLKNLAIEQLQVHKPAAVISGMALGWDQALASASNEMSIPFIAAIPFKGQESMWPPHSKELYEHLLSCARGIKYVCDPGYAAWKMQKRNEWMVNKAHVILALWDGSSGGTGNCIKYAEAKGKEIINCWEEWTNLKHGY